MSNSRSHYRIVQPYGTDKARESTLISEHVTVADAFAEIDRLSAHMGENGCTEQRDRIDRGGCQ